MQQCKGLFYFFIKSDKEPIDSDNAWLYKCFRKYYLINIFLRQKQSNMIFKAIMFKKLNEADISD